MSEAILRISGNLYYKSWMRKESSWVKREKQELTRLPQKQEISPKDKALIRILCLGDSWTFGYGASPGYSYPAKLQVILDKESPDKYKVYNCGIPGCTSTTLLRYFPKFMEKYEPNIVIILVGLNDMGNILPCEVILMANWPKRYYFRVKNAILDLRICKLTKLGIDRLRQKIKFSNRYKSDTVKNIKSESVEYFDRAHELWEAGKNNLAKDYYEKAIDIDPNNELAYIGLAYIYSSEDQYSETLDLITELMRINPYTSAREELYRLLFLMYQRPNSPSNKINSLVKKIPSDESFKNPGMAFVLSQNIIAKNLEYNLEKMTPLIKSKKAIMILQLYAYPFLINRVLRSVSENHNIFLVDNEKIFECFKDSTSYYYHNNHPNENGYQLIAKNVYQILDKIYK